MGIVDVINTAKKHYPEPITYHDVMKETGFGKSTASQLFSRIRRDRVYHKEIEVYEAASKEAPNRICTYIRFRGELNESKKQ